LQSGGRACAVGELCLLVGSVRFTASRCAQSRTGSPRRISIALGSRARGGRRVLRSDPRASWTAPAFSPSRSRRAARESVDGNARGILSRTNGRQLDFRTRLLPPGIAFPSRQPNRKLGGRRSLHPGRLERDHACGLRHLSERPLGLFDLPLFAARKRRRPPRSLSLRVCTIEDSPLRHGCG
jgi:hypothetical protein